MNKEKIKGKGKGWFRALNSVDTHTHTTFIPCRRQTSATRLAGLFSLVVHRTKDLVTYWLACSRGCS